MRKPVVCAITTLDYDHMAILGNSIQEIAWNKVYIWIYPERFPVNILPILRLA